MNDNGLSDHTDTVDDYLQEWKDALTKDERIEIMRRAMDNLNLQDIMKLWDDIKRWLIDG